jgi:hypothetical protein
MTASGPEQINGFSLRIVNSTPFSAPNLNEYKKTLNHSYFVLLILDIGNEAVLIGIEIIGDDAHFYKKVKAASAEECQAQCRRRFFCRAW